MNLSPHPTRATIDLSAFRHNLDAVRLYTRDRCRIMAVVKANAYGHGMVEIARSAMSWGVDFLGVARIDEALDLRNAGITAPILVFEIVRPNALEAAMTEDIDLTIASMESAESLVRAAQRVGRKARVHIKVDTGMGRLGITHKEALLSVERLARTPSILVSGIYSHFATADEPDQTFAKKQLSSFSEILAGIEKLKMEIPIVHMAGSAGIMSLEGSHLTMVRPGIMLYGYSPRERMDARYPLHPIMSFQSAIIMMKKVDKGTSISYGRRYVASKPTYIATVPVGYADGYTRVLTGKTEVIVRGKRYPVAGTICMDHFMIDVGPNPSVEVGDTVTLMGKDGNESITAWDLARKLSTIPYEITCAVSSRVQRTYTS